MNRDVYFVEFKNGDQKASAQTLISHQLDKINQPLPLRGPDQWAFYCNDRRVDQWSKPIRPRSKLLLVAKTKSFEPIDICFENKKLIILNKPPGLPTQATLKAFEDNLYERVRYHFIQKKSFPVGLPYVGLHHRLDRGTSGLVLMTKQRSANKEISDLFKNRKIKKTYRARTEKSNQAPQKKWTQTDFIQRGSAQKKKFFFEVAERGDEAITHFEWIGTSDNSSEGVTPYHEFLCYPKTGRTHQIRVQLKHAGLPILGDPVYGKKKSAKRLMLHAESLEFSFEGETLKAQAPIQW